MEEIRNKLDEYLVIRNRLNVINLNLSNEEAENLNSKILGLRHLFQNKDISNEQVLEKKEALINNLTNLKDSIEKLSRTNPNEGLSRSQFFGNGGIELFKRLCRDMLHIICSKYNGGFGYVDLKITQNVNDLISYDSFINFLNLEIRILSNYECEDFYSFVQYYTDFENRILSNFTL
ncbi:hypothetical protein GGR22_000733 [Flavobacterium gossypii]|uniref:Uncharacterized protein n=1 Tax=Flavobacterium gossypii TaxID=1646119 RepID=A0ABR6DLQ5_9FLAO|nr:hypothetical protein [Flavobacterium gossypii]MBA9072607.1 hypothetical protein [Flavobacterium gossypii]